MKKLFAILLISVLVFSLAACNQAQEPETATEAPMTETEQPAEEPSSEESSSVDMNNFYYGKNITWIVPWGAGGTTDVMSRELARLLDEKLGSTCVILNTSGGGGLVGFNTIIGAAPDGYTIGSISPSHLLIKATGKADVSYDQADFLFMAQTVPTCLVVNGDSEFETLDDFVAYAKENPGELRYSNSGIGAIFHVVGEIFARKAEASFTPVPYESGTAAATAAAGGHVEFCICAVGEAAPMIDSGDLKILAIFGDAPSDKYPDAPTTEELGYPGLLGTWTGVAAPLDIPEEAKALLLSTFEEIITGPDFKAFTDTTGNIPYFIGGDDFHTFLGEQDNLFVEILAN